MKKEVLDYRRRAWINVLKKRGFGVKHERKKATGQSLPLMMGPDYIPIHKRTRFYK